MSKYSVVAHECFFATVTHMRFVLVVHVTQELRRRGGVEGAMFQKLVNSAIRQTSHLIPRISNLCHLS
jgi:hypothetical protein